MLLPTIWMPGAVTNYNIVIFLLFRCYVHTTPVQIYVSYFHIHLFILHGYITKSQCDQLPVGLIAQLVEHCTGIARIMGLNPVQGWIFFRLSFRSCLSCVVTARIFLLFDLSSAVQIYVSYIYIHLFILHGYITNSQYDQLPVGLIAQLVEHCSGIAEVMGSNPIQAWIFFRLSFRNCLSCVVTARIFLLFDLSSAVQNICFIYLHLFIHPLRVFYELTIWPAPSWLDSSVGRALRLHRRGNGFESWSLTFLQAFFLQLLKLHKLLGGSFFYLIFHLQFKYVSYIHIHPQGHYSLFTQPHKDIIHCYYYDESCRTCRIYMYQPHLWCFWYQMIHVLEQDLR